MDKFRKIDLIDVEMAKEEIDRFEKGLERRIRRMQNTRKDDSVPLIRDKGHRLSVLMRDVYMWHRRDYEESLTRYDIVDKNESKTQSEDHTLAWREIISIVHPRDGYLFGLIYSAQEIVDDFHGNLVQKLDELIDLFEKMPHDQRDYGPSQLALSEAVFYCLATDLSDEDI